MITNNGEDQQISLMDQKESIKLIKNTKGYNWEIKLLGDLISDDQVKRLDKLDKEMKDKFGSGNDDI